MRHIAGSVVRVTQMRGRHSPPELKYGEDFNGKKRVIFSGTLCHLGVQSLSGIPCKVMSQAPELVTLFWDHREATLASSEGVLWGLPRNKCMHIHPAATSR